MTNWIKTILSIAAEADNFNSSPDSSKGSCVSLYCEGVHIGLIKPATLADLLHYSNTFVAERTDDGAVVSVTVSQKLQGVQERTIAVNEAFKGLLSLEDRYPCLQGWRNENYAVAERFGKTPLLQCERAGSRLLGVKQYGVHLSGYVKTADGYKLWIARRSPIKATYPGLLDNTVAGGIEAGMGVFQTLIKECQEEASIGRELASQAIATGTISYCHETAEGIERETEFVYELELPSDFSPTPQDDEVSDFYLWDVEQVMELKSCVILEVRIRDFQVYTMPAHSMLGSVNKTREREVTSEIAKRNFKPNCVLVVLQFLLHHGLISAEEEPEYERLACCCHVQLT